MDADGQKRKTLERMRAADGQYANGQKENRNHLVVLLDKRYLVRL